MMSGQANRGCQDPKGTKWTKQHSAGSISARSEITAVQLSSRASARGSKTAPAAATTSIGAAASSDCPLPTEEVHHGFLLCRSNKVLNEDSRFCSGDRY